MKLNKNLVQEILKKYNIGRYISHKYLEDVLENDVYILETSKGRYVLKVLKKVYIKNMKEQIELINFLYSKKIPVVKNIEDIRGKEIIKYKEMSILVQKFVEGVQKDDFGNLLMKDISRNIGKMHKVLLKSKYGKQRKKEHIYKKRNLDSVKKYKLDVTQKELFKNLNNIKKSKLKKTRIHSDLTEVNLLIKGHKLNAIIDWDDSDYDYLVYDIAIFLAHSCVRGKKIYKNKMRIFLREYQKYIKLNDEEKKAIYYLIHYRLFGILNWYLHYVKLHPKKSKSLKKGIKRSVEELKRFNKFSLKEFTKLL